MRRPIGSMPSWDNGHDIVYFDGLIHRRMDDGLTGITLGRDLVLPSDERRLRRRLLQLEGFLDGSR